MFIVAVRDFERADVAFEDAGFGHFLASGASGEKKEKLSNF